MLALLTSAAVLLNILLILLCALAMLHIKGFIDNRNKGDKYMNTLKIKKLHEDAITPTRSHSTDAGLDIYANETVTVTNGTKISTGIAIDIPAGYEGTIRPRSGLTSKTKLRVQLGTVDAGYNGEIKVIADSYPASALQVIGHKVNKGDKIAQLVIQRVELPDVEVVEDFESESARGTNGFGSTDR